MAGAEELITDPRSKLELWLEEHAAAPEVQLRGVRSDFVAYFKKEPVWISAGLQLEIGRQQDAFAESVRDLVVIMGYGRELMEKIRRSGHQQTKVDPVLDRIVGRLKKAGVSNIPACLDRLPDVAEELYRSLPAKARFNSFTNPAETDPRN